MVTDNQMNMKKIFLITGIFVILLASCRKAAYMPYHSSDNIYFDFDPATSDRDSIVFTFAYTPGKELDTVWLPVRISGSRIDSSRTYKVAVTDSGTTAKPGIHYAALQPQYAMPAHEGYSVFPVVVYNTDTMLTKRSVALNLHLAPTGSLGTAFSSLIKARIIISNKLERPNWWTMWLGGYYSQVKHELFLISVGVQDLSTDGLDAPKNLYYVGKLNSFLANPFTWINNNPDKHYVLELRPDGNYDFYNENTPNHRILYKKDPSAGKFFFIDENGANVI
jgi:hypothetical protein